MEQNGHKQIKLSKRTAKAVQSALYQINTLNAAANGAKAVAQAAIQVAEQAQEKVAAAHQTHQQHLTVLIEEAGQKVEDFQAYHLWEDPATGDVYLRAKQPDGPVLAQ